MELSPSGNGAEMKHWSTKECMHPLGPTPPAESTGTNAGNSSGVLSLRYSMIPVLILMWCTSVALTSIMIMSWNEHRTSNRTWSSSTWTMPVILPQSRRSRILSEETSSSDTINHGDIQVGVVQAEYTTLPPTPTLNSNTSLTTTITTTSNNNGEGSGGGPWSATQWSIDGASTVGDRCDWLWNEFEQHNAWMTHEQRVQRYQQQVTDPSSYYRATSHIFWIDFVHGNWSQALLRIDDDDDEEEEEEELEGLDEYATYTWVSGDLHLLNLGAWKNRHGDIVFGMNDFDEGAVHDFQFDLVRLAISIHDQVMGVWDDDTHGRDVAGRIIRAFVYTYVKTVMTYVGNENAFFYELTPQTTAGPLKKFLKMLGDNKDDYSRKAQIKKYAQFQNGRWMFKKGTVENPKKKLAEASPEVEEAIRRAFSPTGYGATLHKFGGALPGRWNDNYFEVLDVAARIGSGVGSYGVDRYYVLIRGESTEQDVLTDFAPIILDVKYQPPGSFRHVVTEYDVAWYDNYFVHSAARVTEAQRKLTAFTDPFTGWILLDDQDEVRPFTVRERSPWKEEFDLDKLESEKDYAEFISQVAFTVATSHVRGNVAPVPGDFKNTITMMFQDASRLDQWSQAIVDLAAAYHDQIDLDFQCFQRQVNAYYT